MASDTAVPTTRRHAFGKYLGPDKPPIFEVRAGLPAPEILLEVGYILDAAMGMTLQIGADLEGEHGGRIDPRQFYALERLQAQALALVNSLEHSI